MSDNEKAFREWYSKQGVKYFSADEFISYFNVKRRGVQNEYPPEKLWKNIIPTLKIVDALREHYNRPITLLSSYRSDAYNKAIGDAAKNSYHKKFMALDITVQGVSPRQVFTTLRRWRDEGKFSGGLGLYTNSGFVHIDTRGSEATWGS